VGDVCRFGLQRGKDLNANGDNTVAVPNSSTVAEILDSNNRCWQLHVVGQEAATLRLFSRLINAPVALVSLTPEFRASAVTSAMLWPWDRRYA
jgi:hypothetical protein